MDDHTVDTSVQPRPLCKPERGLRESKGSRRIHLLYGLRASGHSAGENWQRNGKPAYEILETYKGTDLEGKEYEPLYQCAADAAAKQNKKAFYVTCDTYVTLTDGTGVVHIAPAFGEDDAKCGKKIRSSVRTACR